MGIFPCHLPHLSMYTSNTRRKSEVMMRQATNFERGKLMSMGTKFGRFTKSSQFRLEITCLDYLAQLCQVHKQSKFCAQLHIPIRIAAVQSVGQTRSRTVFLIWQPRHTSWFNFVTCNMCLSHPVLTITTILQVSKR